MATRKVLPMTGRALIPLSLVLSLAAGCSFTKFDDLEEQAPGNRVGQSGSESSVFGHPLVGFSKLAEDPGGGLVIGGTGDNPALNTILFNATGGLSTAQSKRDDFDDKLELQSFNVRALAPAPPTMPAVGSLPGPFVYLGATAVSSGKVMVVDVNKYRAPDCPPKVANCGSTIITRSDVRQFGVALAPAKWDPTDAEDLIVGAEGHVFFLHADPWPVFTLASDQPSSNTAQVYQTVIAGDLDPTTKEHEAVVAAPERNFVAVISGISSCFGGTRGKTANGDGGVDGGVDGGTDASTADGGVDSGSSDSSVGADSGSPGDCSKKTRFEIPFPDKANKFGAALLIADVDGDGRDDLVIGAPATPGPDEQTTGAVYIYTFDKANFDNQTIGAPARVIMAPQGVAAFGTSLAIGKFDGQAKRILAIGAPNSTVKGTTDAGSVVLYRLPDFDKPINTLSLTSPEGSDQLGAALTVMPFRKGSEIKDVLVASAKKSAIVFFANTTSDHQDYRK